MSKYNLPYEERKAKEEADRKAKREFLLRVAPKVAELLGNGWRFEAEPLRGEENEGKTTADHERPYGQLVNDAYRLRIGFHMGGWQRDDRIIITVDYHGRANDFRRYNGSGLEITLAQTKTAEQITKDMARRFMPEFEEREKYVRERMDAHDARRIKVEEAITSLQGRGKGMFVRSRDFNREVTDELHLAYTADKVLTGATFKLNSEGSEVSVQLDYLPLNLAHAVMTLIAGYEENARELRAKERAEKANA